MLSHIVSGCEHQFELYILTKSYRTAISLRYQLGQSEFQNLADSPLGGSPNPNRNPKGAARKGPKQGPENRRAPSRDLDLRQRCLAYLHCSPLLALAACYVTTRRI